MLPRVLVLSVFAGLSAVPALAAPTWVIGARPGSVASDVGLHAEAEVGPAFRALPERWAIVSAIRPVFRERLTLPAGYMAADRVPGLLRSFAARGSEGEIVVPPADAGSVLSRQPAQASGWPWAPEFVNRRQPREAREPVPQLFSPRLTLRIADAGDRRLAVADSGLRSDATPEMPEREPRLRTADLLRAHSQPRGLPGYLRLETPAVGRQATLRLPDFPVDAASDPDRVFVLDLSTQNVQRVFNNPATTIAALFAGLGERLFDPLPAGERIGLPGAVTPQARTPDVTSLGSVPFGGGGTVPRDTPKTPVVPLPAPLAAMLLALSALLLIRRRSV